MSVSPRPQQTPPLPGSQRVLCANRLRGFLILFALLPQLAADPTVTVRPVYVLGESPLCELASSAKRPDSHSCSSHPSFRPDEVLAHWILARLQGQGGCQTPGMGHNGLILEARGPAPFQKEGAPPPLPRLSWPGEQGSPCRSLARESIHSFTGA